MLTMILVFLYALYLGIGVGVAVFLNAIGSLLTLGQPRTPWYGWAFMILFWPVFLC